MGSVRTFYPRAENAMGEVIVPVTVANVIDPANEITFDAMVDTGAFGLVLPVAWRDRLGALTDVATVELETADQRIVSAQVCGPVRIQLAGFRTIVGEAVFVEMEPGKKGYEPLVGYTVLEIAGAIVDMVSHRLVARKYYDLKRASRTPADGIRDLGRARPNAVFPTADDLAGC
jgi:predicted aspartyl protease